MGGASGPNHSHGDRVLRVPDVFARAQAYLLDNLVLIIPCVLEWLLLRYLLEGVDYFGIVFLRRSFELFFPNIVLGPFGILMPLLMIPNLFILEGITRGRTPGKKVSGLRIISKNGSRISYRQAFLRNMLRLIDMFPAYYLIGIASIYTDRLGRRIGDRVADTVVIVEREDILLFMRKKVERVEAHHG
jgi:uncharacterized RDD family membrane protein YckC